jgi:hypothetical protein
MKTSTPRRAPIERVAPALDWVLLLISLCGALAVFGVPRLVAPARVTLECSPAFHCEFKVEPRGQGGEL